ncbi:LapA family protein [Amycolatopsis silviterrae]|uniref:LapA family protein n=1 Tax=Amycolatopsis silviterrae TaxID=1656914 RepID=A0ABW5HMK4_9PSEU
MLWLFGQIWLWLLVSFLLGAAVMWLFTRASRPKAEADPYRPAAAPVEAPAEETRHIPPANPYEDHGDYRDREDHSGYAEPAYPHYDDQPERVYNDYPDVDPDEPYHAQQPAQDPAGHPLPDPEPRLSGELSWPEDDQRSPHWPHDDEPAPRRPGRSG